MPRAQSADGIFHDFPDGTDPAVIDRVMKSYAQSSAPEKTYINDAGQPFTLSGKSSPRSSGLLDPGNIDLNNRPVVKNADGSVSTVRSMSFGENGREVLIPTVAADGSRILSDQEAIDQYRRSGQFLGRFDTPENATAYAQQLHQSQARQYAPRPADSYTGSILPFRRDESGLHFAVPEAIASPARGIYEGGKRASGDDEAGRDPLRPLSPDTMAAAGLGVGASPASRLGPLAIKDRTEAARSAYYRGIRPGGTMTAPQRAGYDANVRQAVDAIIDVHARGERKLPRTPEEFGQSVAATKNDVYQRYSGMAQEAEQKGVRVPLGPAAERLQKLADDPMQDAAAVTEAKRLLALIPGKNASITPTRAEAIMKFLNERASGFDTQGTKGAGSVFREAAGALRGELVDAVHGAGYPDYGKLRQTYGSLVAIEDDIGRATGRSLNKGSSIGLTEAIAVGETAMGSPTAGLATQAMKWLSQRLRSPDRATRQLFEAAGKRPVPAGVGVAEGMALPAAAAGSTGEALDPRLRTFLSGFLDAMQSGSPP